MYKGTKFRKIMDNIEAAVLKSLDQAKEGVSTVTEKTVDAVEELERKVFYFDNTDPASVIHMAFVGDVNLNGKVNMLDSLLINYSKLSTSN